MSLSLFLFLPIFSRDISLSLPFSYWSSVEASLSLSLPFLTDLSQRHLSVSLSLPSFLTDHPQRHLFHSLFHFLLIFRRDISLSLSLSLSPPPFFLLIIRRGISFTLSSISYWSFAETSLSLWLFLTDLPRKQISLSSFFLLILRRDILSLSLSLSLFLSLSFSLSSSSSLSLSLFLYLPPFLADRPAFSAGWRTHRWLVSRCLKNGKRNKKTENKVVIIKISWTKRAQPRIKRAIRTRQ